MWRNKGSILGMAVGGKSIAIAQIHRVHGGDQVTRQAVFDLPSASAWEQPAQLGPQLAAFCQAQGFHARWVVVGLPGRWVLAKPRALPPATPQAAAAALRLALEREFPSDGKQWVFDYAGQPSPTAATTLLVAATPEPRLEQVLQTLAAAKLKVRAVTCTPLALAAPGSPGIPGSPGTPGSHGVQRGAFALLQVSGEGADLVLGEAGRVTALERLTLTGGAQMDVSLLAGEMRRVWATHGWDAGKLAGGITVWDGLGRARAQWEELSQALRVPVRVQETAHDGADTAGGTYAGRLAGGVARGTAALNGDGIDFLHARLAAPKPGIWSQRRRLAVIGGGALALVVLLLAGQWWMAQSQVQNLQSQWDAIQTEKNQAQENVDRMTLVRGWYNDRPAVLDSLLALTQSFSAVGSSSNSPVWATSLTLREDGTGTLSGKGSDESSIITLLDRLRASPRFADGKLLYLRTMSGSDRSVSFAFTFAYVPPAPGSPAPDAVPFRAGSAPPAASSPKPAGSAQP